MFDLSPGKSGISGIYRRVLPNIIYPPTNTMTVGRTYETIDELDFIGLNPLPPSPLGKDFIGIITVPKSTTESIIEVEEVGEDK